MQIRLQAAASMLFFGSLIAGAVLAKDAPAAAPLPPMSPARVLDWDHAVPEGDLKLSTIIVRHGPGSWSMGAGWDEYVVAITNLGREELRIEGAKLTDALGQAQEPGLKPNKLRLLSTDNWYKYRDAGLKLRESAGTFGNGPGAGDSPAIVATKVGVVAGFLSITRAFPGVGLAAIPFELKAGADEHAEFVRRRLVLPLSIAPGATVTGSLFFPMTPGPQQLALAAHSGRAPAELTLDLKLLSDLHLALLAKK